MMPTKVRPRTSRRGTSAALGAAVAFAPLAADAAPDIVVVFRDDANGRTIETADQSTDIAVPHEAALGLRVTAKSGQRLDRVYVRAAPGSDPECRTSDAKAASVDSSAPFRFGVRRAPDCRWLVEAYDDAAGSKTELNFRVQRTLPDSSALAPFRRRDFAKGTRKASSLDLGPTGTRAKHGVRVGCTTSHYAYDDPIVFPGEPDRSHLHMFFGNKSANAHSTLSSLKAANQTTCDGGANLESAYWMPALFNERDETVLPEHLLVYYKSFIAAPVPDRDRLAKGLIKPIPDGLEMLSGPTAAYATGDPTQHSLVRPDGDRLKLTMIFPQCVATHADGRPVLSHRDMPGKKASQVNSHMAYQVWARGSKDGCPASHPYRIPGVFINAWFDVDPDSRWYLASDTDRSTPGHSLHSDYIAAWNEDDMARVVRCNEERRSCFFEGNAQWGQGRLHGWDGTRRYLNSWLLERGQSRTLWGASMKPMRHEGHHPQHPHDPEPQDPQPAQWTKCADEWGRCTLPSAQTVRYGADGQWHTKTLSGTFSCTNATFGDPIRGVLKACYVGGEQAPTEEPEPAAEWTKCADEWSRCTLPSAQTVRYGANGQWRTKTLSGTFACTNATFGDPIRGILKACYVAN